MPSAVEIDDGDRLRPWSAEDAEAVGLTPASPEIARSFGLPLGGHREPAAGKRPFEVGYFLRPDAWGRGLATRSLRLVSEWLLALGEAVFVLCTHPENERSQRVAERAGYRRDGEVADYAQFKDGTTRALRFVCP